MKQIFKNIIDVLKVPILVITYLFDIVFSTIHFMIKLIKNLLEKKCQEKEEDIVAIKYYSEEWPSLIYFTVCYDEKYFPESINKLDKDPVISKKDFNIILKTIKDNKIIEKKSYILNWPYVSLGEYLSYFFECDAGSTTQELTLYFKDGTRKNIIGYSEELKSLRKTFEKVLPKSLFW